MSEISYTFSRVEPKEAVETNGSHCSGNICKLVVGMTATSGGYSAYVDGVTGCLDYPPSEFSGVISDICNEFANGQNFKQILKDRISAQSVKPKTPSDFIVPPINVN